MILKKLLAVNLANLSTMCYVSLKKKEETGQMRIKEEVSLLKKQSAADELYLQVMPLRNRYSSYKT